MKRCVFSLGVAAVVATSFAGCGSDSDDDASPTAGTSGEATAGGSGGEGPAVAGGSPTAGASAAGTSAGDTGSGGESTLPLGGAAAGGESAGGAGGEGGVALEPVQLELPDFSVPGESQLIKCVDVDLGNAKAFHASSLTTTLGDAVYELRVSKLASGALKTTPYDCTPGGDELDDGVTTLAFTHARTDSVTLPNGIGFTFAAHQHVRLEVHALNFDALAAPVSGSVTLTPMPDADYNQEAGLLLVELTDFSLPPGTDQNPSHNEPSAFFADLAGIGDTSIFEVVGGTHKQGVSVTVSYGPTKNALTPLYDPVFDWNQPPHVSVEPALKLATKGLNLSCGLDNPQPQSVDNGVAADDPACRALVYYYPAISTRVCLTSGALSLCCSGGGC